MKGEDFYTVEEAARALRLTPDRIRQMLREGELEGVPPQEGGASSWKIPVRVIRGRDRPAPPIDHSESPTTAGPESGFSGSEEISDPEDIRGEEEQSPIPSRLERDDDAADSSRAPTAPPPQDVTIREVARIPETSVEALLLEAKDEAIAGLRERVAFLERQLEGRAEEIRWRDHIIAALTERIPAAIEAPDHEKRPRAHESTVEEPTRVTPSVAGGTQGGAKQPPPSSATGPPPTRARWRRALWRRVFGG